MKHAILVTAAGRPPFVDAIIQIGTDVMGWLAAILYVLAGVVALIAVMIYAKASDHNDKKTAKDRGMQICIALIAAGSISWIVNYISEKAGTPKVQLAISIINTWIS